MATRLISFANSTIAISYEGDQPARIVNFLYQHVPAAVQNATELPLTYRLFCSDSSGRLSLYRGDTLLYTGDSPAAVAAWLLGDSCHHLAAHSRGGLLFHGAALALNGQGLLLPGQSGSGKSTLAAWLLSQGCNYLSDELVFVPWESDRLQGFPRPLNLKSPALAILQPYLDSAGLAGHILRTPYADLIPADLFRPNSTLAGVTLERIVFPSYSPGSEFSLSPLSRAKAGMTLMRCLLNARNLPEHGFAEISRLVRQVPAYQLRYDNFSQIDSWLRNQP